MQEDRTYRIENKIDKISDRLNSIDSTLSAQHVSLREHMRRTSLLEKQIKPIETHVTMVHGAMKLVGVIAVLAGIVEGVVALLDLLAKSGH